MVCRGALRVRGMGARQLARRLRRACSGRWSDERARDVVQEHAVVVPGEIATRVSRWWLPGSPPRGRVDGSCREARHQGPVEKQRWEIRRQW